VGHARGLGKNKANFRTDGNGQGPAVGLIVRNKANLPRFKRFTTETQRSQRRSQADDEDGSGSILRVLRVSVVRIRAKQSQFPHGQEYATILPTGRVRVCWKRITVKPLMGN